MQSLKLVSVWTIVFAHQDILIYYLFDILMQVVKVGDFYTDLIQEVSDPMESDQV